MSDTAPLAGTFVVDLAQGIAGPQCAYLFAAFGADVVKIEPPEGDWVRRFAVRRGEVSAFFASVNSGKRSVAIDLKSARGRDLALDLCARADVVVDNARPGVMDRLGIGYAAVAARNPRAVYVAVTGYGQDGPYRDLPAYDPAIQALTGFLRANADADGRPSLCNMPFVDCTTGLYAFQAALAALVARQGTGRGRFVDISLMGATAALQAPKIAEWVMTGGKPPATPAVPVGIFSTADEPINLAVGNDAHFRGLAVAIDRPELGTDPRFATIDGRARNRDALYAILRPCLTQKGAAEWVARLKAQDVPVQRVNTYDDLMADPQAVATGLFRAMALPDGSTVPLPAVPGAPSTGAQAAPLPAIGEHAEGVLAAAGYGAAEIEALMAAGVIRRPGHNQ